MLVGFKPLNKWFNKIGRSWCITQIKFSRYNKNPSWNVSEFGVFRSVANNEHRNSAASKGYAQTECIWKVTVKCYLNAIFYFKNRSFAHWVKHTRCATNFNSNNNNLSHYKSQAHCFSLNKVFTLSNFISLQRAIAFCVQKFKFWIAIFNPDNPPNIATFNWAKLIQSDLVKRYCRDDAVLHENSLGVCSK